MFGRKEATVSLVERGGFARSFHVVRLTDPRGEKYFEPGVGQPMTVSRRSGDYHCVMGATITDW